MNNILPKISLFRLFIATGYSVWAACKVSVVFSLIVMLAYAGKTNFLDLLGGFLGGLFLLVLFGGLISFFVALIIGIPVTVILIKSGLDDELISAVIGAMLVFLYCLYHQDTGNYVLFLTIYGFFCAGAYMKGYKNS